MRINRIGLAVVAGLIISSFFAVAVSQAADGRLRLKAIKAIYLMPGKNSRTYVQSALTVNGNLRVTGDLDLKRGSITGDDIAQVTLQNRHISNTAAIDASKIGSGTFPKDLTFSGSTSFDGAVAMNANDSLVSHGTITTRYLAIGATRVSTGAIFGTPVSLHKSSTSSALSTASIPADSCGNLASVSMLGAAAGDTVIATPTGITSGIESANLSWNAFASTDTVTLRACNPTAAAIDLPDTQTWRFDLWKH